jgi:hypothetical protein
VFIRYDSFRRHPEYILKLSLRCVRWPPSLHGAMRSKTRAVVALACAFDADSQHPTPPLSISRLLCFYATDSSPSRRTTSSSRPRPPRGGRRCVAVTSARTQQSVCLSVHTSRHSHVTLNLTLRVRQCARRPASALPPSIWSSRVPVPHPVRAAHCHGHRL